MLVKEHSFGMKVAHRFMREVFFYPGSYELLLTLADGMISTLSVGTTEEVLVCI